MKLSLVRDSRRDFKEDLKMCLTKLLADVEAGNVTGVSFAALQRDGGIDLQSCGEAHANASTASALASALWFQTMKQAFGEE